MCLDNKEHAIYRICKNDTIGPGSNLPFGFTEQIEIVILLCRRVACGLTHVMVKLRTI